MIELTGLHGNRLHLNYSIIETITAIPETKILLTNGRYYLVQETVEQVIERIIEFNKRIFNGEIKSS